MLKPIIDDPARKYFSGEDAARKFLADLLSDIDATLLPAKATLTTDDRRRLVGARVQIPPAFEEIAKVIGSLPTDSPTIRTAYICLHQLMMGAFYAGAFCVVSDSSRDHLRKPLRDGGSKGGKTRALQMQESAKQRWQNQAQELYKQERHNLSQDKLAILIDSKVDDAPGYRQVIGFIRSLDRSPISKRKRAGEAP